MNYLSFNYIGHIGKYNDLSSTQNDMHYINSIGHAPFIASRCINPIGHCRFIHCRFVHIPVYNPLN